MHFALLVICGFLYAAIVTPPAEHPWRTAIGAFGAGVGGAAAVVMIIDRPWGLKILYRYRELLADKWLLSASTTVLCVLVAVLVDQVFLVRAVVFMPPQNGVISEAPPEGKSLELGLLGENKEQTFWLHAGQRRLWFVDFPGKHQAIPVDVTVLPVWHRMDRVWLPRIEVTRAVEQAVLPLGVGGKPMSTTATSISRGHLRRPEVVVDTPRYDVRILFPNMSDLPEFSLNGNPVRAEYESGIATFHLAAGRYEIIRAIPARRSRSGSNCRRTV